MTKIFKQSEYLIFCLQERWRNHEVYTEKRSKEDCQQSLHKMHLKTLNGSKSSENKNTRTSSVRMQMANANIALSFSPAPLFLQH